VVHESLARGRFDRSPPYFLDPLQAAWRVVRANEQVPAAD
jgi:hypothetical protein